MLTDDYEANIRRHSFPYPYPIPNPAVKDSKSMFAQGRRETEVLDEKGNKIKIWEDDLKAAKLNCPVVEFDFVAETACGRFIQHENKSTKPKTIDPYIPSKDLCDLVRLAQILKRPILLKGEPGSGKTQLAKAIAFEWYGERYQEHYFEWHIKSTSKAVDGLYTFDHIARLRDAQFDRGAVKEKTAYRAFGPMAQAFLTSSKENPSILLIDEIDKADIDFPNDLLLELDEKRFKIPDAETGELIKAEDNHSPLIFITSNDERELPEAFLRRCLFMFIKFPADKQLLEIIRAQIPGLVPEQTTFVSAAMERFKKLRNDIEADPGDNKRVSTSEMLDWLRAYRYDMKEGSKAALPVEGLDTLPLYYQALLKTYAAYRREKEKEPPK